MTDKLQVVKSNKLIKNLYLGIDPSLRKLNAALITEDKEVIGVFMRRNNEGKDDVAVSMAAVGANLLRKDVLRCLATLQDRLDPQCQMATIVEGQSMVDTQKRRAGGQSVNYEDIRRLASVSGIMLGVFAATSSVALVQPISWKGTMKKIVAHPRYYRHLGLTADIERRVKNIYPLNMAEICQHSEEKINMGDFWDINDSLGLALYGIKGKM